MSKPVTQNGASVNDVTFCNSDFSGSQAIEIINDGQKLNAAKVHVIFWGSAWRHSLKHSRQTFLRDMKKILASSYMNELQQYGLTEPAMYGDNLTVETSEPPNRFSFDDLENLVSGLVSSGQLVGPENGAAHLYFVMLPREIAFAEGGPPMINARHFSTPFAGSGESLSIAFIHFGTRFRVSTRFSHELIESCSGIKIASSTLNLNGRDEISDICEDATPHIKIKGVRVESYWSQNHCSCVVPK